jgi:hypothetical protein
MNYRNEKFGSILSFKEMMVVMMVTSVGNRQIRTALLMTF